MSADTSPSLSRPCSGGCRKTKDTKGCKWTCGGCAANELFRKAPTPSPYDCGGNPTKDYPGE